MNTLSDKDFYDKIVDWFDVHFGFTKAPLKSVPEYVLNPVYWLGALMVAAFVLQAVTGFFQLIYYVPSPDQAYSSTTFVINSVPLGRLIETLHLYTAYAIILLAFMHLARNYFGSVHKERRELMWVTGVLMMFVVMGFGVTGYLLPWTVISKSATDVAIGFLNFLPSQLSTVARFLIAGTGSDASELQRFLHLHTVLLPGALIGLLVLKIYMYEVHGPCYVPAYGKGRSQIIPWFPRVFLYSFMIFSVFIASLLVVSSLFPLNLPPEFTPGAAGNYVVQPDWYLLCLYQILKFAAFEGPDAVFGLVAVGVFFIFLILLPFYDRSTKRDPGSRPVFVTVGAIVIAEFITLVVWGYLTPGQVISNLQAVAVTGGIALGVAAVSWLIFRARKHSLSTQPAAVPDNPHQSSSLVANSLRSLLRLRGYGKFTALFILLLAVASVFLSASVNMMPYVGTNVLFFCLALAATAFSTFLMTRMVKKLVLVYENGGVSA